jgi:Yip1-like protein
MEALVARVKALLVTPQTEWPQIAGEAADTRSLMEYAAVLALVPALARFVGISLIGGYVPVLPGLFAAVVHYGLAFLGVWLVALAINLLAPTSGAGKDLGQALKLSTYAHTPVWLAGIFMLVPGLSFLTLLGLYGAYLLVIGLPVLVIAPADRQPPFAASVVLAAILVTVMLGLVPSWVAARY